MRFDTPAGRNPIDSQRVVGQPVDRIDGPLKVTGRARYAYEQHDVVPNQAYGYPVGATIAKGRIAAMDLAAARAAPGVLAIVTAESAGTLGKGQFNTARLLGGPEIEHYHQSVAVVVAGTFEQARAAAALVRVSYLTRPGAFSLAGLKDQGVPPREDPFNGPPETAIGDFAAAFAVAAVQLDEHYATPDHAHVPMEPHASLAAWEGDNLTLWTSCQITLLAKLDMAATLGIPVEKVRIVSPFVGGGFGSKLYVRTDAVLAALGARAAGRPVKVSLPRHYALNNTTHRPATIQRIRIGATRNGTITAIGHESWSGNLPGGGPESAVNQTRQLYAGANRMTAKRLVALDLPEGSDMRAPGEAPGMMALEVAMDEMAEKLGLDPIDFRLLNETHVDPEAPARPFSQRQLAECYRVGAERFGWSRRQARPGQMREGSWLIGIGMAAGYRNNIQMPSSARVRLEGNGMLTVETDMTDIGTGSYTIIAQTAAEMMGVPLHHVSVHLGDSNFPISCGSGGQWGGNNATAGVYAACVRLREAVAQRLGLDPVEAVFVEGEVRVGVRRVALRSAAPLVAADAIEYGDLGRSHQQATFASHFVEVGVHAATAEVRIRRMLAVCTAGRILNPKTARSQVIGGMTMGVGAALMEELAVDTSRGLFVNHDLGGYEVPVHADIPQQDVVFLAETDPMSSPMKAKGVGELGICGVGAAVANAIHNATGIRERHYPLTLDKLLGRMPHVA